MNQTSCAIMLVKATKLMALRMIGQDEWGVTRMSYA